LSIKSWFKFILLSLVWGTSFFWIKIALREVGPVTLVFFRVGFATLGLVLFTIFGRKHFSLSHWRLYLFLGFFNVAFPFILISWSEKNITSGMASIMNSVQPLVTAFIAALFIKEERLTLQRILGLLVGFGGVVVLMSNKLSGGITAQGIGILTMFVAVVCYASSTVFARTHNNGVSPENQALGQMSFALIFVIPAMLTLEAPFTPPSLLISYLALAWLGLLGSFFASITWYSLLNEIGPSRVSMTLYLLPLIGVSLGALVLKEKVDWRLLVGGLLIIVGIIMVNRKKTQKIQTAPVELEREG
jgi:drug/metabolite transporter (DMT)-like permease